MARINIELPERFTYSTEIQLLSLHINKGGHLDNAMLISLASETRMRYWDSLIHDIPELEHIRGMVGDNVAIYKSEAFLGETMVIEQAARHFHKYGFDFVWRVSDKASGREVARGKTGTLCFDFNTRKLVLPPEKLLQRLQAV